MKLSLKHLFGLAIMKKSFLENKYFKKQDNHSLRAYKKQKKICSRLYKKKEKIFSTT